MYVHLQYFILNTVNNARISYNIGDISRFYFGFYNQITARWLQLKRSALSRCKLSSQRVLNEHVIGKIKRFKILSCRYRNRRKRFGLRVNLISAIYNFELR